MTFKLVLANPSTEGAGLVGIRVWGEKIVQRAECGGLLLLLLVRCEKRKKKEKKSSKHYRTAEKFSNRAAPRTQPGLTAALLQPKVSRKTTPCLIEVGLVFSHGEQKPAGRRRASFPRSQPRSASALSAGGWLRRGGGWSV